MKTLVFGNQKGGTGKTTLAVLYAHWLAERCHERVAVIDLDSQRNASKSLAAFDSGVDSAALFRSSAIQLPPTDSMVLFAGAGSLVDLEREAPANVIPAFGQHIAALSDSFDSCLIDTPPALGLRMSAALMAADYVACPVELEEYSIDGVTNMLKTIFGIRQKYNPRLALAGIVANRFNPHSVRQRAALADLLRHYDEFVVPARISTRTAIPEALAVGVPVWRLSKTAAREASAEVDAMFRLLRARMSTEDGSHSKSGAQGSSSPLPSTVGSSAELEAVK